MCGNWGSLTRRFRYSHISLLFTIEAPQEPLQLLSPAYNHHIDRTGTNPKPGTTFLSHHTKRGRHKDKQWRYTGSQRKQNPSHCSSLHTLCLDRKTTYSEKSLSNLRFCIKSWLFCMVTRHEIIPATMQAAQGFFCWPSVRSMSAPT